MELVLVLAGAAAMVWALAIAPRVALWPACAAVIAAGYVLGPPLWSPRIGPVALTVDRVLLVALAGAVAIHWRLGKLKPITLRGHDWILLAALAYFTIRCAVTPSAEFGGSSVKPWWRLVAAFWIPAALYAAARFAPPNEKAWRTALTVLAGVGGLLAFTALAEITGQWWAVFPKYIADPELGTHFGRARGPALNSASLGIFLTISFWATWSLWPRASRAWQLLMAVLMMFMALGVGLTFTRSTWLGLAGGLAVVPLIELKPRARVYAGLVVLAATAAGLVVAGDRIANLGRKDTDGSAEHSVYQRASFAYVSFRMFGDAPVFGCGFGRFYDLKIPYLADRSQQIELESLRNLDHHNTLLSVLVETGLVGFGLYMALIASWGHSAWQLIRTTARRSAAYQHGLFMVGTLTAYMASAFFHDLTIMPTEHWLLFFAAGMSINMLSRAYVARPVLAPAVATVGSAGPITPRRPLST